MAISTATTEPKTATSPKSGQGHPYKEMYSRSRRTALPAGADAPDFTLRSTPDHARERKLHFPLLADFEPKGDVARRYGVYRDKDGVSERALFVIDSEGKVHWSFVSPIGVNPGADGILSALEDLQNKQAMPETAQMK